VEEHISRFIPPAAAIGDINVPIGAPDVFAGRVTKEAGSPIYGLRRTLQFEEHTSRCFIEVQVEAGEFESGAIFFIKKGRPEAHGAQLAGEAAWVADDQFTLQPLFIARTGRFPSLPRERGFGGQECSEVPALRGPSVRGGGLEAQAEEAPAAADIRARRIKKGVVLVDAPARLYSELSESAEHRRQVVDP
jgi:hypothetical protein